MARERCVERTLTVREVAEILQIHEQTVRTALYSGALGHYRLGGGRGAIRISEEQLQKYLGAHEVRPIR